MVAKNNLVDIAAKGGSSELVTWSAAYATGIKLIDEQHRELVNLTNELYRACLSSEKDVHVVFKDTMGRMVEYVRFHLTAELELLKQIQFPGYHEHKMQHDHLIKKILDTAQEYSGGKKYVPNQFVRTLKDWIFGHIAVYDPIYALYAAEQKRKGLLPDLEFTNIPPQTPAG